MGTADFRLTPQQIKFFDTFGYLGFPGLLADRTDEIIQAFENVWVDHGGGHAGKAHDGKARSCIVPFIDQSVTLAGLLDDPRIDGIAAGLLGDDYNYMGSDGNFYVGDTGWHSDGWNPTLRHLKIAFYLDPVTRQSGALRVIPGSHKIGDSFAESVNKQIYKSPAEWGLEGKDVPSIALETKPGDLVCFNHNTKHASFGGSSHRRMFTINLCQRYPEASLPDLRAYLSGFSRFWLDHAYGEKMVATATPQRWRHLEQVLANEYELPELSRKAREEMAEPSRG